MAAGEQMKVSGYFTHLLTLSKYAAKAPEGSTIIELGCGLYSTPVLSSIALARGLKFIVYSSDEVWMNKVKPCVHDNVHWNVVKDWKKWDMPEDAYMVFLDNEEYMAKISTAP